MSINVADGQLPAAAAAIYAPQQGDPTCVNVTFQNTSGSLTETIVVTLARAGGTARRIVRATLVPNEQLVILAVKVGYGDVLSALTSDASTVDYVVSVGSGTFAIQALDANGALKQVNGTSLSGAVTAASLGVTAGITSAGATGAGIGYATGAGGAITQATNRTTGVTLSTLAGQITTNNASLAAEAAAEFTVTNTTVAVGDVVVVSIQSGTNGGNTAVNVTTVAAGSFKIKVSNNNAAAGTAETGAIIINFAVIKSVAA